MNPQNPMTSFAFEKREKIYLIIDMRGEAGEKVTVESYDIDLACMYGATVEMAIKIFDQVCEIENIDEAFEKVKLLMEDEEDPVPHDLLNREITFEDMGFE